MSHARYRWFSPSSAQAASHRATEARRLGGAALLPGSEVRGGQAQNALQMRIAEPGLREPFHFSIENLYK